MKFLNRIKEAIQVQQHLDDAKNLNEVLLDQRLAIFQEIVNPRFEKIGLTNWNGKYIWFGDFNAEGIRSVIEYNPLKAFGGCFSFGNCFDFIPTLSGNRLINHRTDKSVKLIYYNRFEGWQQSLERDSIKNPDRISTVNEDKFRKSLEFTLNNNLSKLEKWFRNAESIQQNIDLLKKDIENPPYEIGTRIISSEYILAFLYKKIGALEESKFYLSQHLNKVNHSDLEQRLIEQRILGN